jgi:hypothetical protein
VDSITPDAPAAPFAALAELRTLAEGRTPDADLIAACERVIEVHERAVLLYRRRAPRYQAQARALYDERFRLEAIVATTPARTAAGRRAKAEVALVALPSSQFFTVVRSALTDLLAEVAS